MHYISNPPDAAALMTSARSMGNYDLAGALADLIDNSINAGARSVDISCLWQHGDPIIYITDDGSGMSAEELVVAMRPAAMNPALARPADDLGRFGWGLKSASFSQCRRLIVVSRRDGNIAAAVWDLDHIDDWAMGVLSVAEAKAAASDLLPARSGTEVVWANCDRLAASGANSAVAFNDLVSAAGKKLSLIFHRYLQGEVPPKKLTIRLNGVALLPFDPFHRDHPATRRLEREELPINGFLISVWPYELPQLSTLPEGEHERLGGEDGFLRNQGFYVYRNHRLIIHATWFGLLKFGELTQTVRVAVNIPNGIDDVWKITLDKSEAQLPAVLRRRLAQVVERLADPTLSGRRRSKRRPPLDADSTRRVVAIR